MKKILTILLFASVSILVGQSVFSQQVPAPSNPPRLVNDFAHVMTGEQVATLESKLVAYDNSTSIQIAVVTVPSIGDNAIEDYALKILRDWKIGNAKTNNGILIFASIQDHKVYIATGYGMEGSIPDITAKSIVDNEIIPNFKGKDADNFYRGFDLAADAIIKASKGEYKAPEGYAQRGQQHSSGRGGNIIGLIVIVVIVLLVIGRGRGGGGGGGLFGGSGILPFMLGTMLGGGGRGGWSGGDSGGGGGGGGFGGFGGGSGGGGGAGGSW
jgi:uncharacterized protein